MVSYSPISRTIWFNLYSIFGTQPFYVLFAVFPQEMSLRSYELKIARHQSRKNLIPPYANSSDNDSIHQIKKHKIRIFQATKWTDLRSQSIPTSSYWSELSCNDYSHRSRLLQLAENIQQLQKQTTTITCSKIRSCAGVTCYSGICGKPQIQQAAFAGRHVNRAN